MNKSERPFLHSSFILRVFYLVLTSNNVFTHEIIVSIASLHCKIYFQLLIMYLLIWTQRIKGAKPRTFGSYAKLNHWHFIPKSEKYVKWYFYTRCSSTFFFDPQQNRRKTFYFRNSRLRMRKTKHMNWAKRLVTIRQFLPKTSPTFFLFNSRKHLFFSLLYCNIIHFMLTKQFKQT